MVFKQFILSLILERGESLKIPFVYVSVNSEVMQKRGTNN